jgi:hypothetical protein
VTQKINRDHKKNEESIYHAPKLQFSELNHCTYYLVLYLRDPETKLNQKLFFCVESTQPKVKWTYDTSFIAERHCTICAS